MSDRQEQAATVIQPYFESAVRQCLATGIPLDVVAVVCLQVSCGAIKGAIPSGSAGKEIRRLRDEIFAELTLSAERADAQR